MTTETSYLHEGPPHVVSASPEQQTFIDQKIALGLPMSATREDLCNAFKAHQKQCIKAGLPACASKELLNCALKEQQDKTK